MDSTKPPADVTSRHIAVAAIVVLCTVWSAQSLARTPTESGCHPFSEKSHELTAPANLLRATPVDHVPIATDTSVQDVDLDIAATDVAAPLLDLTPQIARSSREIFDDGADEASSSNAEIAERPAPSSPIAEMETGHPPREVSPESPLTYPVEDETDLPLLQRRMFRTDI